MSAQSSGQAVVTIRINGTPYSMGCDVGQEAHVENLGRQLDQIVSQLAGSVGQIGEARLLAMAGLILADQLHNAQNKAGQPNPSSQWASAQIAADQPSAMAADEADELAAQLENLTAEIKMLASQVNPT